MLTEHTQFKHVANLIQEASQKAYLAVNRDLMFYIGTKVNASPNKPMHKPGAKPWPMTLPKLSKVKKVFAIKSVASYAFEFNKVSHTTEFCLGNFKV